jgi:transcriptional regulator with GAF, ATPase, and Fis domain
MANILASSTPTADSASGQEPNPEILTEQQLTDLGRQNTLNALRATDWRVSGPNGAAKLLGLKPTTLADRMKKLGISRPEQTAA